MKKIIVSTLCLILLLTTVTFDLALATTQDENTNKYNDIENLNNEELEKIAESPGIDSVKDLSEYYNVNLEKVNIKDFDDKFSFLTQDEIFIEAEEHVALQSTNDTVAIAEVESQWGPIVAQALRTLVTKVGKPAMTRAWMVARPHVRKAIDYPKRYILEGPKGGRIIQVRSKSTKKPVFRLDYHRIDGKGPYLHYHIAPNIKKHHML